MVEDIIERTFNYNNIVDFQTVMFKNIFSTVAVFQDQAERMTNIFMDPAERMISFFQDQAEKMTSIFMDQAERMTSIFMDPAVRMTSFFLDQAEKMTNIFLDQAIWLPEELKNSIKDWIRAYTIGGLIGLIDHFKTNIIESTFNSVDFQRAVFEKIFSTVVVFQDQAERMTSIFLDQAIWLPEELKNGINDWTREYKRPLYAYKEIIDKSFDYVSIIDFQRAVFEKIFSTVVVFQDQAERMTSIFLDQAIWLPEEGKKAVNEWVNTYTIEYKELFYTYKQIIDRDIEEILNIAEGLY